MGKHNNAIEPTSKYFTFDNNRKFWFYESDPGVKHNNEQCRTCLYRSREPLVHESKNRIGCDYILIKGHMRGCHPSPTCTKYVKGERKSRRNLFNPHGRNGFASPYEPDFVEIGDGYST